MKEKKYRKLELLDSENQSTDFLYFDNIKVFYQKFSGNVRGYDVILVGGIERSSAYSEGEKSYIDVETIEDKKRRKEISNLLIDTKKGERNQEVVYFYDMEYYNI